jgi:ribonuclease BN (tRNA processing enzyme)
VPSRSPANPCSTLEIPDGRHGHMSAAQAGEAARIGEVDELVLTHFPGGDPELLDGRRAAAAAEFGGPVQLATPGARFPVSRRKRGPALQ